MAIPKLRKKSDPIRINAPDPRRVNRYLTMASIRGLTPARIINMMSMASMGDIAHLNAATQELRSDVLIGGYINTRVAALKTRSYRIEGDDPDLVDLAKLIIDNLKLKNAAGVTSGVGSVISALSLDWLYGISIARVEWEIVGDYYVPAEIRKVDERLYKLSRNLDKVYYMAEEKEVEATADNLGLLISQYDPTARLEYLGVGANLLPLYYLMSENSKNIMAYQEKFSVPAVVASASTSVLPIDFNEAAASSMREAVEKFMNDSSAVLPPGWELKFPNAAPGGENVFKAIDDYATKKIQIAILGQDGTSSGSGGSLAKAQVNELTRQDLINGDADRVQSLFQILINRAILLNFGEDVIPPRIYFYSPEEEKAELEGAIARIQEAKAVGLPISKKYAYNIYGIPEPEEGEELL